MNTENKLKVLFSYGDTPDLSPQLTQLTMPLGWLRQRLRHCRLQLIFSVRPPPDRRDRAPIEVRDLAREPSRTNQRDVNQDANHE